MADALHSNWTIPQVLAAFPGVVRVDSGDDLLAARVRGSIPTRTVYLYLYGDDPDAIFFDLEDTTLSTAWDHAVHRGQVQSLSELREIVTDWLENHR
jgi:hypothetical protein